MKNDGRSVSKQSLSCSTFYGASSSSRASHREGVSYVTVVRVGCINLRPQAEDDECAERTCARGPGERGRWPLGDWHVNCAGASPSIIGFPQSSFVTFFDADKLSLNAQ